MGEGVALGGQGNLRDVGLVCHHCGYSPGDGSETTCPREGRRLVEAREHRKDPRDPFLGSTVGGKYVVTGILGAGGMGVVYRALQEPVGRAVALKVLRGTGGLADELRARFLREARAVAALNHPGIVTLFDFGVEADGTQFMVMELVPGTTLRAALKVGMDRRRFLAVMAGVLDALAAAHGLGLVHRDLKPENIMLVRLPSGGEQVKVLDFGLAKVLEGSGAGSDRLTRTGVSFGTPQYMSPEQAAGAPVDARSDLYSVGVMLFEGLAGRVPFDGPTPLNVLFQHHSAPIPELPPDVGEALARVVRTALAKVPADRFPDASTMQAALRAATASLDARAPGPGATAAHAFPTTLGGATGESHLVRDGWRCDGTDGTLLAASGFWPRPRGRTLALGSLIALGAAAAGFGLWALTVGDPGAAGPPASTSPGDGASPGIAPTPPARAAGAVPVAGDAGVPDGGAAAAGRRAGGAAPAPGAGGAPSRTTGAVPSPGSIASPPPPTGPLRARIPAGKRAGTPGVPAGPARVPIEAGGNDRDDGSPVRLEVFE